MQSPAPTTSSQQPSYPRHRAARPTLVAAVVVFAVAFGVRLLCWRDARFEAYKVQSSVAENYRRLAGLLKANGLASFYDPSSPTSDPDLLGHPPGYPFVLVFVHAVFGGSDAAVQLFQAACDSLAAALVFLIAAELLTFGTGLFAGVLVALAPQFCWNSLTLLPDTLAVLPLLAAVWLLVRAREGRVVLKALGAGALVGASCWLRANGLLLAPFLAVAAVPLLFAKGGRWRPALGLVAGALLVLAPMTLRNAVVYGHFIPVSLGAGQTLVEGIADYDREHRFGLPDTDLGLTHMEAEEAGRPEYGAALFTPDGIERDRWRTRRALAVIRENPGWFAGVMIRRACSMLRLERTPPLALRAVQRVFITAVFLPLYLFGLALLLRQRRRRELAALLAVPLYFLCVQSALHTEYRYVLAVHYLLFVVAAFALRRAWLVVYGRLTTETQRHS
ncbi:MAG: glycosyltransferase family 39 protein [Acidobacteria bacterium]|nr:glycosyltransferase family 39 protein [Acidobacteriota bacterium]